MAMLLCIVMVFSVACTSKDSGPKTPTSPDSGAPSTPSSDAPSAPSSDAPSAPSSDAPSTPDNSEPEYPVNGAEKIVSQKRKFYESVETVDDIDFYHYESTPEILLIDAEIIERFMELLEFSQYEIVETETTLTITRSNGATCVIDFVEDSVTFDNFDLFNVFFVDAMSDRLSNPYLDSEDNPIYFQRTESTDIGGLSLYIDLANRNIPLDIYEGKKYVPLQTFNDLFFAPYGVNFLFNTKDVFLTSGGQLDPALMDEYYSIQPTAKSEALADFSANELCLLLDLYYGLQDEHGVLVGFELYLEHTGLLDDLSSTDATKSSSALFSLTLGYLADLHSGFKMASPYTGSPNYDPFSVKISSNITRYLEYDAALKAARAEAMPDGVPGYEEIGNTAYVTFDSFTLDPVRYEEYSDASKEVVDTVGLIIYAHSQITRENSPVENVVLDLSCNGGGIVDSSIYVVAWMLGYCDFHLTNPITNSFSTSSYLVDVNLDGEFDEKDSIADKNLYCLISPISFSGGNLVPSLLKESGKVTLLGGTSGGGACEVQVVSTADGSLFQISSSKRLSVVDNGSYYTVDRGVEPHYFFGKNESYFNREALTEYINELK